MDELNVLPRRQWRPMRDTSNSTGDRKRESSKLAAPRTTHADARHPPRPTQPRGGALGSPPERRALAPPPPCPRDPSADGSTGQRGDDAARSAADRDGEHRGHSSCLHTARRTAASKASGVRLITSFVARSHLGATQAAATNGATKRSRKALPFDLNALPVLAHGFKQSGFAHIGPRV